ncbi:MAG TPA: tripartite tricarboxylate transporter substrate-binding protein, partial [Burkholderiaceae bacterium]|nr:tripartite tricarboxylate transporter substrate-binding protein [Burkholderiaceae bacterium]
SYARGSQADLMFQALNRREGVNLLAVPYKGVSATLAAAAAGEVQLATGGQNVIAPLVRAGKLKALAIAGSSRGSFLPQIRTTAEQGYPYALAALWYGLYAPAGTPEAVLRSIHRDVTAVLKDKDFAQKNLIDQGLTPVASSPEELARRTAADVRRTAELVQSMDIKPE